MGLFKVRIIETYSKTETVEADSLSEAIDIVSTQHENEEIDLMGDYDCYDGVDFKELI